jgi:hypothetical protein
MKVPKITIKSLKLPTPQTLKLLFISKNTFPNKSKINLDFWEKSVGKDYYNEPRIILQSNQDHQEDQN